MESLLELFCAVDDFCQEFLPQWERIQLQSGLRQRQRARRLSTSELLTLLILSQQLHFRDFKTFYTKYVSGHLQREFPGLVSYERCIALMPSILVPLCAFLQHTLGTQTGQAFIDSTALPVCHNRRISSHRVFAGLAARGKTSMGWFFGFKLHLVINEHAQLLSWRLTPGNTDDRIPVPALTKRLHGILVGDKGYLSRALTALLSGQGLRLLTPLRKGMRPQLLTQDDALHLRARFRIESIFNQLKNHLQICHTRHRSLVGLFATLLSGLLAFSLSSSPSLLTP